VEPISSTRRNQHFESPAQDAFHLELRDDYSVADEDSPFTSWLCGETVDYSSMQPWTQLMRRVTGEGKAVRRVRVITEQHSLAPRGLPWWCAQASWAGDLVAHGRSCRPALAQV
jgi:hypothetical protein